MPTILTNGIQLPDKGSVDWYNSMQSNYNLIDTHLGNTDIHVTAEDKANWDSKQGSLSQAQLDAIAQVATNTSDIATLQSGKANASHTHSSSDITDIGDYATKQYVDNSISGLVDSAPNALDTLNELAAALNDDANFASTVATALSAKANSADLATVATSGSYTDLTDKPTIPTNTSDLTNDSGFVVSSNLATIATSGDYDDLSNKPSIPTNTSDLNNDSGFVTLNDFDIPAKTSDLTNDSGFITSSDVPTGTSDLINDSNFVDTSNSAVASGITSAKVTSYDSHIADTDIHVTTADKTKWNNGVSQAYVFRYSSTALVASSTNSNSLLDNTDNLKVGDKVIDSSGVLFSITAIDTANSTFTIGTALVDLATDSDVVHKSGNETVAGFKEFANIRATNSIKGINLDSTTTDLNNCYSDFASSDGSRAGNIQYYYCNTDSGTANISNLPETRAFFLTSIITRLISSSLYVKQILINSNSKTFVRYCNNSTWSSWVNETDKYVTTDTAQTISGSKTFSRNVNVYNSDSTTDTANIILKNSKAERGSTTDRGEQTISFLDKDNAQIGQIKCEVDANGVSTLTVNCTNSSNSSSGIRLRRTSTGTFLQPTYNNVCNLGTTGYRWYDVQTRAINNLEPSSLSLPDIDNKIDISSYITDLTGAGNGYTPTVNGWISVRSSNATKISILDSVTSIGTTSISPTAIYLTVLVPCIANRKVYINIMCTSLSHAYFIPCQGNV